MFGNMGSMEMMVVLVIVLLLFGPKNLPKLAQSIGRSVRELKNGLNGLTDDIKDTMNTPPEQPVAKPDPLARPITQSDAQPVRTAQAAQPEATEGMPKA